VRLLVASVELTRPPVGLRWFSAPLAELPVTVSAQQGGGFGVRFGSSHLDEVGDHLADADARGGRRDPGVAVVSSRS
jgi:hypothetical protein